MPSILITGCSTGIGHAAAELFAERGWTVYAGSRSPDQMTFKNASIQKVEIDVNNYASIEKCFQKIGDLDCIVNNAGYGLLLPFEDTPAEEIEKLFRTNVLGLMEVSRRAAKMMREKRSGSIINVSSVLGAIGMQWYAPYCATKWAVEGFSESIAHELKSFNVHVKIIEPSGTKTEFHHVAYDRDFPITDAYKEKYEKKRATRPSASLRTGSTVAGGYDTAESIAELIWQAANDDSWRLRYAAPQAKKMLFWQRVLGRDGLWKKLSQ
ncbi:MAG: SDR family oxidoreductase [Candidatus Peribacteraceae bacterium]|nr:SDR family oxidoreductase [Candidatus Peribacteraceae bacterium]